MASETFTLLIPEDQRKQFEFPFGFDVDAKLKSIFPNVVIPDDAQFTFTRDGTVYVTHGEPTQEQIDAARSMY